MSGTTSETFEAVILRELQSAWKNYVYKFKWTEHNLLPPNFRITEASVSHWGQWTANTREMDFSRFLVTNRPWNEVLEVLKHEMAHQYVSEVLHLDQEVSHGPVFQGVCKKFSIDAAARGVPGADKLTTTNHIVEKIQHLLKLAENPGATEGEKEAAASAAHSMMLKYNIEVQTKNEERGYTIRYLGGITGRIQAYMSEMANMLSKHYFVEVIWMSVRDPRNGKDGHELEASGLEANVEVAEYVYDFLSRAAVEAWERKFSNNAFKLQLQEEFARQFGRGSFTSPKGYTISARSNFLHGFILGFRAQLKQAEAKEVQAGMVLAKDTGLEEFYHNRHPHIRNLSGGHGKYNSNMRGEGFAQGNALKIPAAAKANRTYTPLLGK
jgi:Protein of unknown function (DUF2786)/SprT-like family